MALANYAVYCASKAAVNMLTRSLAIEFGRDGVHVNCIAPGNTATPMNENLRTEAQYEGFVDMMARAHAERADLLAARGDGGDGAVSLCAEAASPCMARS